MRSAAYAATTNVNVSLASITDGTSNTAAVSESLVNDGAGNSPDGRRNLNYTNSGLVEAIDVPALAVVQDGLAGPLTGSPGVTTRGSPGLTQTLGRSTSTPTCCPRMCRRSSPTIPTRSDAARATAR